MPQPLGRDRLEPTTDGTVVLLSLRAKGWTPGTAVRWDDSLFEVLASEPREEGGFRHVLAPWDERKLVRSLVEYGTPEPAVPPEPFIAPVAPLEKIPRPLRDLAIGFVFAVLLGWFFPIRVMGEGMSLLVHELGHTAVGWLFGCTAIPAIVMTIAFEQSRLAAALIWGLIVFAAVRFRKVPRWNVALAVGAALYPVVAFTGAYLTAFDLGGHLAEAGVAAWAFRRALRDERPEWERPIWSFFAFYLVWRNVKLFGGVALSGSARTDYLTIAITGQNDLVKVAATTGVSLGVLAGITAIVFLGVAIAVVFGTLRPRPIA